jgi:ribose 5-phosphate isomerase
MIVNAGRAVISARLYGTGSAAFTSIGIGTGTTAAAAADTTLQTEVKADGTAASGVHALAAASTTASSVTTTVTNDTAQWTGNISITATIAVTECGLFNADTNGTLAARQVFSAVNVASGDTLSPTWKIKNA